jgi:CheY-like chemotaxis protein
MGQGLAKESATVLVADDDRSVREMIRTVLELDGYQVVEAENGREAWSIIRQQRPPVVIADIQMPHLNGLELCRKVKADGFRGTRVIVYTAGMATEKESQTAGCDGYLLKTAPISSLREAVRKMVPRPEPKG